MAQSRIVVLNGGGLRSLVALATVANRQRVATVFVHDGRLANDYFHQAAADQAKHFKVDRMVELAMPHLRPPATAKTLEKPQNYAPLASAQMIVAVAGVAAQTSAEQLIWPVQPSADHDPMAAVSESLMIIEDLVHTTLNSTTLKIETPLLEMTDRQLIEIGHQMDVPWQLARTCIADRRDPCHSCWGCYHRRKAFEDAGIEDPQPSPLPR
ncbi:MAG: 7-cyano-7-deazaguanine synthase [Phycisphaeraceae bacterium]